jgi:uncharacterized protein (TIGR00369 family)
MQYPSSPLENSSMWKKEANLETMQTACANTLVQALGIEFTAIGPDYIEARMPVDACTKQPAGILHGGASLAFAETLGGAGAYLSVPEGSICLGLEINANHVRPALSGWVTGRATCLHKGRTTQVWQVLITDAHKKTVCISRQTIAVRKAEHFASASLTHFVANDR